MLTFRKDMRSKTFSKEHKIQLTKTDIGIKGITRRVTKERAKRRDSSQNTICFSVNSTPANAIQTTISGKDMKKRNEIVLPPQ
jgi:hypothetical protein